MQELDKTFVLNVGVIASKDNKYFVLGDNRVNSTDSRIIGAVSIKDIRGTTKLTIYPFKRFGNKN